MAADLVILAVLVGGANWCFRVLPMVFPIAKAGGDGPVGRFLSATGPAAIATLFVAEMLPLLQGTQAEQGRVGVGVLAVMLAFAWRKSVVFATLSGACACGVAAALGLS